MRIEFLSNRLRPGIRNPTVRLWLTWKSCSSWSLSVSAMSVAMLKKVPCEVVRWRLSMVCAPHGHPGNIHANQVSSFAVSEFGLDSIVMAFHGFLSDCFLIEPQLNLNWARVWTLQQTCLRILSKNRLTVSWRQKDLTYLFIKPTSDNSPSLTWTCGQNTNCAMDEKE